MRVGIIDVDAHKFPNLALMKIAAYHKKRGDEVEWAFPLATYDRVYQAKVFDELYSKDIDWLPQAKEIIKGGTGYFRRKKEGKKTWCEIYHCGEWRDIGNVPTISIDQETYNEVLPPEIEHIYPNYHIYPKLTQKTAFGFLTRGCPRHCDFCLVGDKEGVKSVKVADLKEFWKGQKNIKLLDPNLLACRDHLDLLEQLARSKAYVDFTQGLDIRMTTAENIEAINRLKVKQIHFAWDNPKDRLEKRFEEYAAKAAHKPHGHYASVYVLTNFNSTMEENLHRIYTLRDMGFDPYVMIYDKPHAPREIRLLQRWVNNKPIFKRCDKFEDYDPRRR